MKNYIYQTLIIFTIGINATAQSPSWAVIENNFQYTMTFVAFSNIDGTELSSENDKVAAFVNGECRGVTKLVYVASKDSYYAYLTIFSNENSETINFKIYDSTNEIIKDVAKTISFEINEHYGNLFQAFSLANPPLRSNAQILDFNFTGVYEKTIEENQISLEFDTSESTTAVNADFELSPGSNLYIGSILQVSGNNVLDFNEPIHFQVLSEDQSVLKQWEIFINESAGIATFYKKDAVCYEGGVIKILNTENDVKSILEKNGVTIAAKTIYDGETVFNNLEAGVYLVKVGGNVKEITINLKQ